MKKRLFAFAIMIMAFACLLAISVSAENKIIKLDTLPTLEEIHANPSAYISTVDALESTEYKEKDPNSVIVLGDSKTAPTYYYVYPTYYFIRSSSWNIYDQLSETNAAIAAADSTAFAAYTSEGGTYGKGRCDFIYRVEVPTYVTSLTSNYKFESNANVKEVYFPTKTVVDSETGEEKTVTYVGVSGANTFTGCKNLETIGNFEYLPASVFNSGAFSGCSKLAMDKVVIPESITSIPSGVFSGCKKIESIVFHDKITYIGTNAFYDCDAITEIILPNSVTTICKKSFSDMDGLVTISFGAGLTTMGGSNGDCEILTGSALKYVYMPATFASKILNSNGNEVNGNGILSGGSNVTLFFTGTEAQATELKTKLTTSMSNKLIKNATFVEYDENQDYDGYADTLGYTILVYGLNVCDTFYEGIHNYEGDGDCAHGAECTQCADKLAGFADHVYEETLIYEDGFKANGVYNKYCTNISDCVVGLIEDEARAPIFVAKAENGYSTNGEGIAFGGYTVDVSALNSYNSVNNDTPLHFGIIVVNPKYLGDTFMADGNVNAEGGALLVEMDDARYSNIKIMLDGFTGNAANLELVISLYAYTDTDNVEFVQSEHTACASSKVIKADATLYTVTLNSVENKPCTSLDALPEYKKDEELA